jgi:cell division protein FtsL
LKRSAGLKRRVSELAGSAHARGFALWAAALITGLVCVWQHVHANELASEIGALRSRRSAVRTEIGLLEMECAGLSRRERVERYATERLGMRYPRAGEVVWLRAPESGRAVERQEGFVGGGTRNDAQG